MVGEIHLYEGEETDDISVRFLDDEGAWIAPAADDANHSLEIVIGNGDMIEAHVSGWEFHIEGLGEGETWIRVRVLHGDHADYLSPRLPVHVEHSEGHHAAPVGMRLKQQGNILVQADSSNNVTGHLDVTVNDTTDLIEAFFFDADNVEFQPESNHSLSIVFANGSKASVRIGADIPGNTNIWAFTIIGSQAGSDTAVFSILHDGHSHYNSPAIEIHVNP